MTDGPAPPDVTPPGLIDVDQDALARWLAEGREAMRVLRNGDVVSLDVLKRLVVTAVPVMEQLQPGVTPLDE